MKTFLFGLGVGLGLGLLFAPMSGEETRNNLADRAGELAGSARASYAENLRRMQRSVDNIRESAEWAVESVRSAVEAIRSATV